MPETPNAAAPRSTTSLAIRAMKSVAAAARNWWADDCLQFGAALAFHALLSLAPLLFTVVFVFGMFLDDPAARSGVVDAMGRYGSPAVTSVAKTVVSGIADSERSVWGVILSVVLAVVAASTVFGQLQRTLNRIWQRKPDADASWVDALVDRALAAAMIALFGLTVLISSAIAWLGAVLERAAGEYLPSTERWLFALDVGSSWAIMSLVIACIFRWLPDVKIGWRNVFLGGAATAGLFLVGKAAVGYYVRFADVGSAYGAAGSIVVFVVWVYYTSQMFLFGAECTAVWAGLRPLNSHGKPTRPHALD